MSTTERSRKQYFLLHVVEMVPTSSGSTCFETVQTLTAQIWASVGDTCRNVQTHLNVICIYYPCKTISCSPNFRLFRNMLWHGYTVTQAYLAHDWKLISGPLTYAPLSYAITNKYEFFWAERYSHSEVLLPLSPRGPWRSSTWWLPDSKQRPLWPKVGALGSKAIHL